MHLYTPRDIYIIFASIIPLTRFFFSIASKNSNGHLSRFIPKDFEWPINPPQTHTRVLCREFVKWHWCVAYDGLLLVGVEGGILGLRLLWSILLYVYV